MRRLAVLVMAALLALPGTAVGQDDDQPAYLEDIRAFAEILVDPALKAALDTGGATAEDRQAIREAIAVDRVQMLNLDPLPCWMAAYLYHWDTLTLIDAGMVLFEDYPAAALDLMRMATEHQADFDAGDFYDCP